MTYFIRLQKRLRAILFVVFFLWAALWIHSWILFSTYEKALCNSGGPFGIVLPLWLSLSLGLLAIAGVVALWLRDIGATFGWPYLLIIAGGLSNLLERIFFGCIMDYVALPFFPVFNIADISLTVGVMGVLFHWYIDTKKIKIKNYVG